MKKILSIYSILMFMVLVTGCDSDTATGPEKIDMKKTLNNALSDTDSPVDYVDTETDLSDSIGDLAKEGNEAAIDIIDGEINDELNKKLEEMGYDDGTVNEEVDNSMTDDEIETEINDLLGPDDEDGGEELDEGALYDGECLFTYGSMVVGENLSAEDHEWKGYHKLANEIGKVPTRMSFSANGHIKLYTKPMEIEDWRLMQEFNVDRMRVPTDDEDVDDIVEFPKALNHCLFEDTKANVSKDFPCITLYPEGAPIQAKSPFNVEVCLKTPGSITVDMLMHTFYLSN